jgi:hypothetical protein
VVLVRVFRIIVAGTRRPEARARDFEEARPSVYYVRRAMRSRGFIRPGFRPLMRPALYWALFLSMLAHVHSQCPLNYYAIPGNPCTACPQGTYSPIGSTLESQCVYPSPSCPQGKSIAQAPLPIYECDTRCSCISEAYPDLDISDPLWGFMSGTGPTYVYGESQTCVAKITSPNQIIELWLTVNSPNNGVAYAYECNDR